MSVYNNKSINILKKVLDRNILSEEESKELKHLLDLEESYVYKCTYDKEQVIDEIFYLFEDLNDEVIINKDEAEQKIMNCEAFFNDLYDDLTEWEDFPDWNNFSESVHRVTRNWFEVSDGKLYLIDRTSL